MSLVPQYLGTSLRQSLVKLEELFNVHVPQLSLTPFLPPLQLSYPACLQVLSILLSFQLSGRSSPLRLPVPEFIHLGPYLPHPPYLPLYLQSVPPPHRNHSVLSRTEIADDVTSWHNRLQIISVFSSKLWPRLSSSPTPFLDSSVFCPLRIPSELYHFVLCLCPLCSFCLPSNLCLENSCISFRTQSKHHLLC